jgi:uncharacterized membrane protein
MERAQMGDTVQERHHADRMRRKSGSINVGTIERWISAASGGFLLAYGLLRRSGRTPWMAAGGGLLVYRGVTGHSFIYRLLRFSTARWDRPRNASVQHNRGIRFEKSLTIDRQADELFHFWRNFENLPRFMETVKAVRLLPGNRSHWVVAGPMGDVEWDAELYNEEAPHFLAWRTLSNADVSHAGSVHFENAPTGNGTLVTVEMNYEAPGGKVGEALAKLFGGEPGQQVENDLQRLKQLMESGSVALDIKPAGVQAPLQPVNPL